ncbi:MAG: hypothetical protein LBC61_06705 [Candidatus Peribacteria bacterium]|jgi:hypothetical protein|nr:hypothetical protein [Candidatus Peribacteria bacterium]
MAQEYTNIRGNRISVHSDGHVFVNGNSTGIKQWSSSSTRWSNLSGRELSELKGLSIEEVLRFKGFI